jgi:ABC-type Mn2+/Zn2+ transport system ATPase subunit
VLSSVLELVHAGRSVVISEHRLDRLMPSAHLHVVIGGARVDSHDPRSWRRATVPARPPRLSPPGEVTWSLNGATASLGGQVVLHDVYLDGRAGEIVVLAGPNGGGKTTLLRLIAGAVAPLEGRVERRPGRIAYLPQNPAAILHRPTLRAEVRMTLERSREDERPESILEELGLLAAADRYPRDLSSGERQRAALAAVLPGRPALVLLDEPTRGMDSAARSALIGLLSRLRDAGAAIVLATHDDDLRAALADRVVWVAGQSVTETALEVVGR